MSDGKTDYTREELIAICEAAVVPKESWYNRDSDGAQRGVGVAWMLLKSGHDFEIQVRPEGNRDAHGCFTDHHTIWVKFTGISTFSHVDWGDDLGEELIYLPTQKRLDSAAGKDWY